MSPKLEAEARRLYDACQTVKPTWDQLGDVTKGVWRDRALLEAAGIPEPWSHLYNLIDLANVRSTEEVRIRAATTRAAAVLRQFTILGRPMSELNLKKLADQFDELAATLTAISGTFRTGAGGSKGAGVDGKTAGRTPAGKAKAAKVEEGSDEELTIDAVRAKLKELVEAKGKDKMVEALESVGAGKLADVDESQYQELVDTAQGIIDEEEDEAPTKKPAAKKTAKAKKGPSLEDVNTAAKALIEADKPAYMKLTKKLGKPSEMDESDYAAAIEAYEGAMPEEGGEDDLL